MIVVVFIIQCNLFVTPEKLEIKHREILRDISTSYSTKEQYNDLKAQIENLQLKIDKIYDIITKSKGV